MHIKGDYTEFDVEASSLAAEAVLKNSGLPCAPSDVAALADEAYSVVGQKMYANLVRILLSRVYGKAFDGGLDAQIGLLAEGTWKNRDREGFSMLKTAFQTDLVLLGMGAPAHVFLPKVAAALGTKCILPDHAEIGNAIGAVMAELVARASVSVTQWDEGGLTYMVHTPEGSVKYRNLEDAVTHARRSAAAEAVREALARGAQGELHPVRTQHGNTHDGRATESLTYGGTVTAEVRYSHLA